MGKVEWIKIVVGMFDNPKIKYIRTLPEGNNLLLVWIMILTKAGVCNSNGYIFLTESIPYTPEMLAKEFEFDTNIIKLALATFNKLNMINLGEESIYIEGWKDYQNIEGLEKIREQTNLRVNKHRTKKKQLSNNTCNVTSNVTVTHGNETEEELEEELEEESEEESEEDIVPNGAKAPPINYQLILAKWNDLGLSQITKIAANSTRQNLLKCRIKDYGIDSLITAIENIKKSDFLQGKNDRGWVVSFDWMIKPNNFQKVLEGNYTTNKIVSKNGTSITEQFNNPAVQSFLAKDDENE